MSVVPYVDFRRCRYCSDLFPRSRFMVRRGTITCASCQRKNRTNPDHMRAIGQIGHESQRVSKRENLEPRLADLSKAECYLLGRKDEYSRLRGVTQRQEQKA